MSDREPDRLADASEDPGLRELLGAGRKELPDDKQLAAVMAKLGPVIGGGGGGGAAAAKGVWLGGVKGLAVASGLAAVLGGIGFLAIRPREAVHDAPPVTTDVAPPLPSASAPVSTVPSASAAPSASVPPHAVSSHAAAPRADDTEAQVTLLRRAQEALKTSPEAALGLADEYAHLYPGGMFRQESEVIAIDALVRTHRSDAARARATKFRASYPTSAHLARIDTLLKTEP